MAGRIVYYALRVSWNTRRRGIAMEEIPCKSSVYFIRRARREEFTINLFLARRSARYCRLTSHR